MQVNVGIFSKQVYPYDAPNMPSQSRSNFKARTTRHIDVQDVDCDVMQHVDVGSGCFLNRYFQERQMTILNRSNQFLLWDYLDLSAPLSQWSQQQLADLLTKHAHEMQLTRWASMILLRMERMEQLLSQSHDARFAVEKDKCQTMLMLSRLQLPHASVRQLWNMNHSVYSGGSRVWGRTGQPVDGQFSEYSKHALGDYLKMSSTKYPAILKVGHMHQQKSTVWLPDRKV